MNITLNEYIHENNKIKLDDKWRVVYEPFDNKCITDVTGAIYVNQTLVQTFSAIGEISQISKTVNISGTKKKIKSVSGYLAGNTIVLYWNEYPGDEHFLCVSYEYHEQQVEQKLSTWLQEGF